MTTIEKVNILVFAGFVAAVYLAEIFLVLVYVINKRRGKTGRNMLTRKPAIVVHLLAITGVVCFLYGYFIEPYWVEVNTIQIQTDKLANTSLRVVQISDLHCDKKIRNENKLAGLINPLKPDIIVFTGDCLNTTEALAVFQDTLKSLKAQIGKYAVKGNWDTTSRNPFDLFANTNFKVLEKQSIKLQKNGETFYISGLDAKYNSIKYHDALTSVPDKYYSIFLYHYPDLAEDLGQVNVDLYLAGHTHGGQVALPFYGALITLSKHGKKYESGKFIIGNTTLYVNRGLGLESAGAPKVRFFARPEITIFDIKPKKQQAH